MINELSKCLSHNLDREGLQAIFRLEILLRDEVENKEDSIRGVYFKKYVLTNQLESTYVESKSDTFNLNSENETSESSDFFDLDLNSISEEDMALLEEPVEETQKLNEVVLCYVDSESNNEWNDSSILNVRVYDIDQSTQKRMPKCYLAINLDTNEECAWKFVNGYVMVPIQSDDIWACLNEILDKYENYKEESF